MSRTYSLTCHETKQRVWIGQGGGDGMRAFYSGEPKTMDALHRFLQATLGKSLVLLCNDEQHGDEFHRYEEFT